MHLWTMPGLGGVANPARPALARCAGARARAGEKQARIKSGVPRAPHDGRPRCCSACIGLRAVYKMAAEPTMEQLAEEVEKMSADLQKMQEVGLSSMASCPLRGC